MNGRSPKSNTSVVRRKNLQKAQVLLQTASVFRLAARLDDAEDCLRRAITLHPESWHAITELAALMRAQRRHADLVRLTHPDPRRPTEPLVILLTRSSALKALNRLDEALACNRLAVAAYPDSGVAHHNLAATLGDIGLVDEAEQASAEALGRGLDGAETWLVRARALQALGRLHEADAAFRRVLAVDPGHAVAYAELAQLIWMQTGNVASALNVIRTSPHRSSLPLVESRILEAAGRSDDALAVAERGFLDRPSDAVLAVAVIDLMTRRDPTNAVTLAEMAIRRLGPSPSLTLALAQALLAAGRLEHAAAHLDVLRREQPDDQRLIALATTVWRLQGDPRYREACDYDRMIQTEMIGTPSGWYDLETYLAQLKQALIHRHLYVSHPVGLSLRHGSQIGQNLLHDQDPAIRALFAAFEKPLMRMVARTADMAGQMQPNPGKGYAYAGAWSVRLTSGGFHVDHVHPAGWLSCVFYVEIPAAISGPEKQGWLQFGKPGVAIPMPLEPERMVRPEPGMLVAFPSYFWHGTRLFDGSDVRLTCAFDLVPGRRLKTIGA